MKKHPAWPLGAGRSLVAVGIGAAAPGVRAHEERSAGALHSVVGGGDEPAYSGSESSVEQDFANIQFPAKDPSNGQLATRHGGGGPDVGASPARSEQAESLSR